MFDKNWFKKRQKQLLWLLNKPIIKLIFRWCMRIRSFDLPINEKITEITPNSYSWGNRVVIENGKLKLLKTTDFRTHNKYSKRVFYAFKPLWAVLHAWDIVIANNLNPAWNLGFDQTFYPDANPESTSVDGYVQYYLSTGATWATMHDDTGGTQVNSDGTTFGVFIQAHGSTNWTYLKRSYALFDTSAIPDGVTISSATLSIKGTAKADAEGWAPTLNIYSGVPASDTNLVAADYNKAQFGTTAYCDTAITYAGFNTAAYNDFVLNATGIAAIDKAGITKIGIRNVNYDVADTAPSWVATAYFTLYAATADTAGTASDPKLVVATLILVEPPAGTITLTGQVPVVSGIITIEVPTGTITITPNAPTITKTGGYDYQTKHYATWTFTPKS